jgi:hypothetical protein
MKPITCTEQTRRATTADPDVNDALDAQGDLQKGESSSEALEVVALVDCLVLVPTLAIKEYHHVRLLVWAGSSRCLRTTTADTAQLPSALVRRPTRVRPIRPSSTCRDSTGALWASKQTARARLSSLAYVLVPACGPQRHADQLVICAPFMRRSTARSGASLTSLQSIIAARSDCSLSSSLIYSNMAAVQLKRQNWSRGALRCCRPATPLETIG